MPIFKKILPITYLATLLFPAALHAEGEKLLEVQIQGNRRIEAAAILNVVKFKAGDTLYTDKTDADIREIYKLGYFQDVKALVEQSEKGTILIYSVLEKPIVRDIKFEGNKELTTDKLKEVLEFRQNAIFSQKDLTKSVVKMKKLYGDDGYYLAEITPQVDKTSTSDLTVTFKIVEGLKILISDIRFEGNAAFSNRKLRGIMETKEKWFMSWLTGAGTYKEEVLKNDALLITDHYLNNGFINVKVGEPVAKLNDSKTALDVFIGITEGDQYRIGEISFKGDMLEPATELRKKIKSEPGEVFNRSLLRTDIFTLTDVYADKGYAFANVNPMTRPDTDKKTVDMTFDMEKGELVYIDRINIAGNPKTRDKVVRREMRVTESELYSATGMKRSKQNLMNTGYFEEANIATARGSASNKLNVNVDVKEKPTGTFSIGGGYSSLDGFIGQGSVAQSNFLGLGLKANVSASIGGKSQTYSIGMVDPHFLDTKWSLGGDIYRSERDYTDYTRRLLGGDIKAGYPINDFVSVFSMYKYEIKDIYNESEYYKTLDPAIYQRGSSTTSAIFNSITHNNTDYRLDPTTGMINSFAVDFAGLGGDNKYARYTTDHNWFHPIYKKLIFSTKLTLGYIQEVGKPVPIDEKFYLGGIFSLRGYKARTVSPTARDINTNDIVYLGGDKEVFGTTEFTFPILQEVGVKGVVFFDYGSSFNDFNTMFKTKLTNYGGGSSLLMSYGGGIRWASPIGPLRLEYGIPVNPRIELDNKSGRFEFSIGSLF